jgi:hypothetical protein
VTALARPTPGSPTILYTYARTKCFQISLKKTATRGPASRATEQRCREKKRSRQIESGSASSVVTLPHQNLHFVAKSRQFLATHTHTHTNTCAAACGAEIACASKALRLGSLRRQERQGPPVRPMRCMPGGLFSGQHKTRRPHGAVQASWSGTGLMERYRPHGAVQASWSGTGLRAYIRPCACAYSAREQACIPSVLHMRTCPSELPVYSLAAPTHMLLMALVWPCKRMTCIYAYVYKHMIALIH